MSAQPVYHLRAERGGLAPDIDLPRPRMTPAEIPLTLSADVLRLPYPPAVRLVLAEIVSLYAANEGRCDASDKHFADRLTISTDTASRAVQQLEADGLLAKDVLRLPTGFYRTLVPNLAAIVAKAETNPYPQNAGSTPQNAGRVPTRKMPVAYPQNAASPTRILPVALPAKCGSNIPFNIPSTFQETYTASANASEPVSEKKIEEAAQAEKPERQASHTKGGAADVATSIKPGKPAKCAPEESPAFLAFWQAYPRHDGKVKAAQAFARLSSADQALATELAPAFFARRTDWISPEGTDYRPYAATWLNGKRWKEAAEPLPTTSTAAQPHATHSAFSKPGGARHHVPQVDSYGQL